MSRRARLGATIVSAALIVIGLGGCARFDDRPVQVAAKGVASDCVVGSWRQSEGWQRLSTSDLVTDLRLISGGRTFEVKADGTARFEYANPTLWKNDVGADIEVIYAGSVTLTYTAKDGEWNETADATKATTTLTLNGTKDTPRPGVANRVTKATYRCDEKNLILTSDAIRQAFIRT